MSPGFGASASGVAASATLTPRAEAQEPRRPLRLQSRARDERRRSRRADRHHSRDRHRPNHNLIVNLLAVMLFASAPAAAQEGDTTNNISNPIATSTGSVNNQAVQINQGGFSRQTFGGGVQCNGPTMVFSPFYLGNDTHGDRYVRSQNFGAQISFSVPLDGGMTETCKSIARKRLEKERLDYELIRALKCAELMTKGFTFRPESPFAVICSDVTSIAALQNDSTSIEKDDSPEAPAPSPN